MSEETRRTLAAWLAGLTFLVVLVFSLTILLYPVKQHWSVIWEDDPFNQRMTTSTVTKITGGFEGDRAPVTVTQGGGAARKTVTSRKGRVTEQTTTVQPADASFAERTLGESGLLIGRIALAVLAAFLAAAIVQRVILGHYSVKIGTLELGDLPAVAGDLKTALEEVKKSAAELKLGLDEERARGQEAADALKGLADSTANVVEGLQKRLTAVEQKLSDR